MSRHRVRPMHQALSCLFQATATDKEIAIARRCGILIISDAHVLGVPVQALADDMTAETARRVRRAQARRAELGM